MKTTPRPGSLSDRLAPTRTLLVVDDEDDLARFVRAWFSTLGWEVHHCDPRSVSEIVDAVERTSPDAILLDLALRGGLSGEDAYAVLRSERVTTAPIVIITAHVVGRDDLDLQPEDALVPKPFSLEALQHVVIDLTEGRAASAEDGPCNDTTTSSIDTPAMRLLDQQLARLADAVTPAPTADAASVALVAVAELAEVEARAGRDALPFVTARLADWVQRAVDSEITVWSPNTGELVVTSHDLAPGELATRLRAGLEGGVPVLLPGGRGLTLRAIAGVTGRHRDPELAFSAADAALDRARSHGSLVHVGT